MSADSSPVRTEDRLHSLDVIRGFALLGILLMNIVGFGLARAHDYPSNAGGASGLNLWFWILLHVLAEGKMRCLFSMVFGAGVILLTERAERGGTSGADLFLRRNLWLLGAGILHSYLLWHGEILYAYGLCALGLYAFRKMPPKGLLSIGAAMIMVIAGCNLYAGLDTQKIFEEGQAAAKAESIEGKLSPADIDAMQKWKDLVKQVKPGPEEIEKINQKWRGSILDVLQVRAEGVAHWHNISYYHYYNLDVFSMMFIGMGLFQLGVFSALRSRRFYLGLAALCYGIGLPLNCYTAYTRVSTNFDIVATNYSLVTYDIGRLSIALGHTAVLILLVKSGTLRWLTSSLGAVGQMALTNYLMHSVICSTIFCGYGFALFGRLERYQLYYVVFGIWVFQLISSPIWLRHFQFGPAEWAWRSLTYWKKQPLRRAPGAMLQIP
jgi:uncharacterized protein